MSKVKAFCLNSLTIAWGYFLALVGSVMECIDGLADALGDPHLKEQITQVVGDAKTLGRIMLGISVITIIARMRSLRKAS